MTLFVAIHLVAADGSGPFGSSDFACALQGDNGGTCFYDPNACTTPGPTDTPPTGTGVTIDNTAAQQAAKKASAGGTQVGYALYDSTGKLLANDNDTFENYGASITKSMLLVAYLQQVGSGTLSSEAMSELTNMIENSDNASADWVFSHLTGGASDVNKVASSAGMTGFQLDDSSDPIYVLGQSKITANDFAKFFSKIDTMFPASQKSFALKLLSNLSSTDQNGLLQAGLPGTVYSKEGWKPESSGQEGAPYIVNQAAQFSAGGTTYGVAVTVGGTSDQSTGEGIVKDVVSALVSPGGSGPTGPSCSCPAPGGGGGPVTLVGSDNEEKIYNYFVAQGLTSIQAAAIDGNFGQESGWDPTDPGGYLAQWGGPRLTALQALATKEGKPVTDLGVQLDFVWQELNSDYASVLKNLKAATAIDDAVNQFMGPDNLAGQPVSVDDPSQRSGGYEDPGIPAGANRVKYANHALNNYGGGAGGGSCTSGSPNCATVTGNAKILCAAQPFKGVYYEYGGGHESFATFQKQCPDPSHPPNNQPHGGPINGDPVGASGNPSPCGVDCSALVDIATQEAFGVDMGGANVAGIEGSPYWQKLTDMSSVQPGDIVTVDPNVHVEIVDHYDASAGKLYTFGAHDTGSQDGIATPPSTLSSWSAAYRYIGTGHG